MRIVSMIIGLAMGAYITLKVVAPLPASAHPCGDKTDCTGPSVPAASSDARRPGLRIALYDPAMAPQRQYETEAPHAAWVSSAESDSVVSGMIERLRPGTPASRQAAGFKVTGLGQPGAQGVCLVFDGGKRRCLAVIGTDQE